LDWREYEDVLQRVVTENLGPARSAWGLDQADRALARLEAAQDQVRARDGHDLCRLQEVYNLLTVARCMLTAARFRTESRFGLGHHRLDYPATDDARWLGQVLISADPQGRPRAAFHPLHYD
jgi:succinate dehydrogenase/fumarate reductase flavoprotein subunit